MRCEYCGLHERGDAAKCEGCGAPLPWHKDHGRHMPPGSGYQYPFDALFGETWIDCSAMGDRNDVFVHKHTGERREVRRRGDDGGGPINGAIRTYNER